MKLLHQNPLFHDSNCGKPNTTAFNSYLIMGRYNDDHNFNQALSWSFINKSTVYISTHLLSTLVNVNLNTKYSNIYVYIFMLCCTDAKLSSKIAATPVCNI
jgi:hypothetical protein